MAWLFALAPLVVFLLIRFFIFVINQNHDRKGPTYSNPAYAELYKLVGKARAHRLMSAMKEKCPSISREKAISELIKGIRRGDIKR